MKLPVYMESQNIEEARLRAASFKSSCLAESTKKSYQHYQSLFIIWCEENFDELIDHDSNDEAIFAKLRMQDVTYKHLEAFLCGLARKSKNTEENPKYLSGTSLRTARAALRDLYMKSNVSVPPWWDIQLKELFRGITRQEAQKKQTGELSDDGKTPLPFSIYSHLMKYLMCYQSSKNGPFLHLFGILCWNLIARGDTTETLALGHIGWQEDALVIHYAKMKNDQEGDGLSAELRHIYANPISPWLCPVLALALYMATTSFQARETQLFPGGSQKERMLRGMHCAFAAEEGAMLGGRKATQFGNHSFRKGSATYATAGSVAGPSSFAVLLRGGWSVGGVISKYIRYDPAGDQYVGRILAGLNPSSSQFATLPPHFKEMDSLVKTGVSQTFPTLLYLSTLQPVLYMCFASLLYHRSFLKQNLPVGHPIFQSYIFTQPHVTIERLENKVSCQPGAQMVPTGIPPHVAILKQLEEVKDSKDSLLEGVERILKHHGAMAPHATRFQLDQLEERISQRITSAIAQVAHSQNEYQEPRNCNAPQDLFLWKGAFHRVREDFKFPSNIQSGFYFWFLGNAAEKLPPLRTLNAKDLVEKRKQKTFSDWKLFFDYILKELIKCKVEVPKDFNEFNVQMMWKKVVENKLLVFGDSKNRVRELNRTILTCVKHIRKARRRHSD